MKSSKWLGLAAALHAMAASAAQDAPTAREGNDHAARKPDAEYVSAFAGYRRFVADEPLVDWRAANDEVRNAAGAAKAPPASGEPPAHPGHKP